MLSIIRILGLSILFIPFLGYSQTEDQDRFSGMPADSVLILLESEIELSRQSGDEVQLVQLLKLKDTFTDSLDLDIENHKALAELLLFESQLTTSEYHNLLLREGGHLINLGSVEAGLNLHVKALAIADSLQDDAMLAETKLSMGAAQQKTGSYEVAKNYFREAYEIYQSQKDSIGMINCYMNLGTSYRRTKVYDTALYYYTESMNLSRQSNYLRGVAGNLNNIGNVYRMQKDYQTALDFYFDALQLNRKREDKTWESYNLNNIGGTYSDLGNYKNAVEYLVQSEKIKMERNDQFGLLSTYKNVSRAYAGLNDYENAYDYLDKYLKQQNALKGLETARLTAEIEAKMQSKQRELVIEQLESEKELRELTIETQRKDIEQKEEIANQEKNFRYAMIALAILLVAALIYFWRTNNQRKARNAELEDKNEVIEAKSQEILSSINYAKRIQSAILPPPSLVKENLPDSFVLYKPKDVVAGDFYWMEKQEGRIFIAAADCTGHGVPGAMVSVVCNNCLNRSVREFELKEPGKILDKTRELVIQEFEKSEEEVKDGMDIALCALRTKLEAGSQKTEVQYAGAHNALWIVRKGAEEVVEIRADKQPIGKYAMENPFTTHTVELNSGDTIYLFSDGFADQFGGPKSRKFKSSNFRKLLVSIKDKNMDDQRQAIDNAFEEWRGDQEQVDDVVVIGVRV